MLSIALKEAELESLVAERAASHCRLKRDRSNMGDFTFGDSLSSGLYLPVILLYLHHLLPLSLLDLLFMLNFILRAFEDWFIVSAIVHAFKNIRNMYRPGSRMVARTNATTFKTSHDKLRANELGRFGYTLVYSSKLHYNVNNRSMSTQ